MNFFWEWETKSINNYYNNNSYVFLYICNCNFIGPDATPENVKKMAKVGMFSDAHLGLPVWNLVLDSPHFAFLQLNLVIIKLLCLILKSITMTCRAYPRKSKENLKKTQPTY